MSRDSNFINSVSHFLDRLRAGCVLEFVANPKQGQAAGRFSTLYKPILSGDDITLNIRQNWKNRHKVINKLISDTKNQLVKISSYKQNGKKKCHLFTDNVIVEFVKKDENQLNVLHIREDPYAANLHFKQLLPKSTITINAE